MPTDSEPRTEAGRALLSIGDEFRWPRPEYAVREAIAAIEAEAARLALAGVAERVRALPSTAMDTLVPNTGPDVIERAAVLALLFTKEDGS